MEDVTWSRVGTVTSLFLRCLRIVKNKRLPDDISYRVMTFDTERALTTAKEIVTITVNHLTARAADRLGGRGEKFDAKPEPISNCKGVSKNRSVRLCALEFVSCKRSSFGSKQAKLGR